MIVHPFFICILQVTRNGNKATSVCGVETLEDIIMKRPDDIIQTHNKDFRLLWDCDVTFGMMYA